MNMNETIFTDFGIFVIILIIMFYKFIYRTYKIHLIMIVWRKIMSAVMQDIEQVNEALTYQVVSAVKGYLNVVGNKEINLNLYQLIMEEIEAPLFRTVMELMRYNQSKAARVLGVSRGTLRTKLKHYFDDEFIGTRD